MKKFISIMLMLTTCVFFVACSDSAPKINSESNSENTLSEDTPKITIEENNFTTDETVQPITIVQDETEEYAEIVKTDIYVDAINKKDLLFTEEFYEYHIPSGTYLVTAKRTEEVPDRMWVNVNAYVSSKATYKNSSGYDNPEYTTPYFFENEDSSVLITVTDDEYVHGVVNISFEWIKQKEIEK